MSAAAHEPLPVEPPPDDGGAGFGVGFGVGRGAGVGVTGVGFAVGFDVGVAVGFGAGVAVGAGVGGGVAAGFAAVAKRAVIGPEIGVPSAPVASRVTDITTSLPQGSGSRGLKITTVSSSAQW